jgi:hypothetical protein
MGDYKKLSMMIFQICYEINQAGKYFTFVHFSGHVEQLSVRVTVAPDYATVIYDADIYLGGELQANFGDLEKVFDTLCGFRGGEKL